MKNYFISLSILMLSLFSLKSSFGIDIDSALPITPPDNNTTVPQDSNLWFILDSSSTMNANLPYNEKINYELPKHLDGSRMQIPGSYTLYYVDPMMGYIKNNKNGSYGLTNSGNDCSSALNKGNCRIWQSYYRTKLLTLKSTFLLSLYKHRNDKDFKSLRVGYAGVDLNPSKGGKDNILPLLPMSNTKNLERLYDFIYGLDHNNIKPTILTSFSKYLADIALASANEKSKDNPFLEKPGVTPSNNNKIVSCRRNYIMLGTAGLWEDPIGKPTGNGYFTELSRAKHLSKKGLTERQFFPDGRSFIMYPRVDHYVNNNIFTDPKFLSDLAFVAWSSDLDGNSSNNDLKPIYRTNDTRINRDKYWHPHNDQATWQHINTFTINFNVDNKDRMSREIRINKGKNSVDTNGNDLLDGINLSYASTRWVWTLEAAQYNGSSSFKKIRPVFASDDLALTALASKGEYYNGINPKGVYRAFDSLISQEKAFRYSVNASTVNKLIIDGPGILGGNNNDVIYYTSYDINGFVGNLLRKNLYNGENKSICFNNAPSSPAIGSICDITAKTTRGGKWDAALVSSNRGALGRPILSSYPSILQKTGFKVINFDINDIPYVGISEIAKGIPDSVKSNMSKQDDRFIANSIIDYLHGNSNMEFSGKFRRRDRNKYNYRNWFGAITRTSPVYVSTPQYSDPSYLTGAAETSYKSYIKNFNANNKNNEKDMIFLASNAGLVYGLSVSTAREEFSYVPYSIFDKLGKTTDTKTTYGLLNGSIITKLVNIGYSANNNSNFKWRNYLLGGFGSNTKGFYAIDITKINGAVPPGFVVPGSISAWEYSETESKKFNNKYSNNLSNIGNILAKPSIIQLHDNTWVAITGNGYNSVSGKAAVIVVNLENGDVIQELTLSNSVDGFTDHHKHNGLGPLSFAKDPKKKKGKEHLFDRAYAGDLQGNLWVLDLAGSNRNSGIKVFGDSSRPKPLFESKSVIGFRQPITVAPLITEHPSGDGYLVHFGTGSLFSLDDDSSKIYFNSIYAIQDDWLTPLNGGVAANQLKSVSYSDLNVINYNERSVSINGKQVYIRSLPNNVRPTNWKTPGATGTHKGWTVKLLDGQRAWQPPYFRESNDGKSKAISYNISSIKNKNIEGSILSCKIKPSNIVVESWTMALNEDGKYSSNASQRKAYIDFNSDNKIDKADIDKNSIRIGLRSIGIRYNNIAKKITFKKDKNICSKTIIDDIYSDGSVGVITYPEVDQGCAKSDLSIISWKQLY